MNFTREPIIETIISPKDGYKLCIRNSKISGVEELFVDAIEVVSFGHSLFYRAQERPKPFLVPVSDYEIFEVKETRVVLKNIVHDRNIKIGGGREASLKVAKEVSFEKKEEIELQREGEADSPVEVAGEVRSDRKRDRRRSRRRRLAEERRGLNDQEKPIEESSEVASDVLEETSFSEEAKPVVMFNNILPPPPVLISERLNQLKSKESMAEESSSPAAFVEDMPSLKEEEVSSKVIVEEGEDRFPF